MVTDFRTRNRRSGQYVAGTTRVCKCGHLNHVAERGDDGTQECIGHEFGECEEPCGCQVYRPTKVKKSKEGK